MGRGQQTIAMGRLSARRGSTVASLAEVRAMHPDVDLEATETSESIVLSLLRVAPGKRGSGVASAAFKALLAYADGQKKLIALNPEPLTTDRGLSKGALTAWYASHGFKPNKGRHKDFAYRETYIRLPSSS